MARKPTARRLEVLRWVQQGHVKQTRFPGSTYTSWTTIWGQSGEHRNVSNREMQKFVDEGLITTVENHNDWVMDTLTGTRVYCHIAVLTEAGQKLLED